jgi:hydroxyacylglutathione hydrolase
MLKVARGPVRNQCHVAIDVDTRDAVLIDPAWDATAIEAVLDANEARPVCVLLTHAHRDHVDLADHFARRFRVPALMSRAETERYRFRCHGLETFADDVPFSAGSLLVAPYVTPGHTKGSTCYRVGSDVFTGDTLFTEGCGICTPEGGSAEEMFESLQSLKRALPGGTRVHPGHSFGLSSGRTMDQLRRVNVYLAIERREDFVRFRMRPRQRGAFEFA